MRCTNKLLIRATSGFKASSQVSLTKINQPNTIFISKAKQILKILSLKELSGGHTLLRGIKEKAHT